MPEVNVPPGSVVPGALFIGLTAALFIVLSMAQLHRRGWELGEQLWDVTSLRMQCKIGNEMTVP